MDKVQKPISSECYTLPSEHSVFSIYDAIISLWLYNPYGPWPLFYILINTQSVGLLGRGSARRKATTYAQNNIDTE
jgi:hypothetical protein